MTELWVSRAFVYGEVNKNMSDKEEGRENSITAQMVKVSKNSVGSCYWTAYVEQAHYDTGLDQDKRELLHRRYMQHVQG